MTSEMRHLHLVGATGKCRVEMYEGREHLVVPVVALMEGVIHAVNSDVPELVPLETLQRAAASWNNRPVVLGHPVKNGRQCSANSPDVLESHGIGTIRNSRVEGSRLLMDTWIDKAKAEKLHPVMLARLLENQPEEVSVGAHVVTRDAGGFHNGRAYKASWAETTGDHLAFLPGGRGACSMAMGCGAHRAASYRVCEESLMKVLECPHLETIGTLLDETRSLLKEADSYVGKLQASDDGDVATLEAVETLAMSMTTLLNNVVGLTYKKRAPSLPAPSSPTYLEAFRAAIGKTISAKNMKTIQAAHDSSHAMHDHTTALGAECNGMRLLAKYEDCVACGGSGEKDGNPCEACDGVGELKVAAALPEGSQTIAETPGDCSTCKGTGKVFDKTCEKCDGTGKTLRAAEADECEKCKGTGQIFGKDCDECDGTGEVDDDDVDRALVAKAAAGEAAFRAACSCGEGTMTKDEKDAIIKTLVADKHSGFTAGDEKMLEGASDERLESFRVAASARATTEKELRTAAERKLTAEEWKAAAPPEILRVLARQEQQETDLKAALVSQLKVAQAEYSEAELSVMPVADLTRLARVAHVPVVDYSGRAVPRSAMATEKDTYEPPDPYADGLKVLQARNAGRVN